jgi:hypothetical protein
MENQFKGKCLGTLADFFGVDCKIEIEELDCWWNLSNNITLIINKNQTINCSRNLSNKIREQHLDENTERLKSYLIYEFIDGGRYVTHLQRLTHYENIEIVNNEKDNINVEIKVPKRKKVLTIAKRIKNGKITTIKLSNAKLDKIINDLIVDIGKSGENIEFSNEELLDAIWSLTALENSSKYIKRGYYLDKQAFLFKNVAEVRFSIFGMKRLALVTIKGDVSLRTVIKK